MRPAYEIPKNGIQEAGHSISCCKILFSSDIMRYVASKVLFYMECVRLKNI